MQYNSAQGRILLEFRKRCVYFLTCENLVCKIWTDIQTHRGEEESDMKRAVIFPGIGYHKDKPLLYYSMRLAKEAGYEIICVDFSGIPWEKGDLKEPDRMKELFAGAMEKVRNNVDEAALRESDEILFISKSIGTVAAACYTAEKEVKAKQIYYSPVVPFGMYVQEGGIAFYGDADPLADAGEIEMICGSRKIDMYRVEGGNHSLETGDVQTDLQNLQGIMKRVKEYISET